MCSLKLFKLDSISDDLMVCFDDALFTQLQLERQRLDTLAASEIALAQVSWVGHVGF